MFVNEPGVYFQGVHGGIFRADLPVGVRNGAGMDAHDTPLPVGEQDIQ